ncbi:hypothetical protein [Sphingopyxis sp. MWB1]|uniref:hypothetical protein n=1 Tax=Sphingopyxis sp. MWB1 TaxID=1537715 RepID=UPI00051A87D8|nr:hypothetical protein [Sphingopyxis sp. MWB1]
MVWTLFEYLYRDADNHKAFGQVALAGRASPETWHRAFQKLDDGRYFIAEQLGLPSLCGRLYRWDQASPTDADHCWHEYVSVSILEDHDLPAAILQFGEIKAFIELLSGIETWNIFLSPNVRKPSRT